MNSIEFLGHSGFAARHRDALLLCDPWMSPTGAYNASWFPYPAYPEDDLGALLEPDAVYISHEHLDHFDPDFLARLDRRTPIVTGRFQKKRLLVKLRKMGFREIFELDDFESYTISDGFTIRIATPTFNCPPHWFDSCCILEMDGRKVFNLNDCNLALPVDRLRRECFDVMFAQASPAIWYPLVYTNYPAAQKRELMAARRESAIESFLTAAKAIRPALAVPCAGPPCFFDDELAEFFTAPDSMFPTPPIAARRLSEETDIPAEVLKPGDHLVFADDGWTVRPHPRYREFDYERDRIGYYEEHKEAKRCIVEQVKAAVPEPAPGLFDRFKRHLVALIEKNPYFRAHINMRVLFDVTGREGGRWIVDFRDAPLQDIVYADDGVACRYRFAVASKYLDQVLRDEMSWEDMFLSLRFAATRDPDVYNQHLFTFFKMGDHSALQKIATAEMALKKGGPEDVFTLAANGATYEVQRFCPHAGSDLSRGKVVDGHLVCAGHNWKFDLETGRCAHADYSIHCVKKST